jgi:hypothetical protein
MARNASMVRTASKPSGTCSTAASSSASSPATTSLRLYGDSRDSTRSRMLAPTFDPHPAQRMPAPASSRTCSGDASRARSPSTASAAGISGSRLKRCMKRWSIQFFQRQTQRPSTDHGPRDAIA